MTSQRHGREDGLGLIELIVSIVVAGIVFAAIATIFTRSFQTQEQVISVSDATTRGQLVGSAIERAVRNALYVQVSESGGVLRVSTSLDGSLKCQGFRISSAAGGSAQFSSSETGLTDPTTWPEWQTGIEAQGVTPFFDDSVPGVVSYEFQVGTEAAPVRFRGEVTLRSIQEGSNDSCWTSIP